MCQVAMSGASSPQHLVISWPRCWVVFNGTGRSAEGAETRVVASVTYGASSAERNGDSVRSSGQAGFWARRPALQRGCCIGRIDGHMFAYREQGGSEGCDPDA